MVRKRVLALLLAGGIIGISASSGAQSRLEENKELQKTLSDIGLLAGNAMQCADKAKQEDIVHQVFTGGNLLTRDEGLYAAYYFMIYFGVGSAEKLDKAACEQILADWQKTVTEFELE